MLRGVRYATAAYHLQDAAQRRLEMSELASGPAIQSGTAEGLLEFADWVVAKGYGSSAAWTPLKSAANRVFKTVEGTTEYGQVDLRALDVNEDLSRYEVKARGQIKSESIAQYRSRFVRAVEAYRQFLDTGQPPRARRVSRSESTSGDGAPGSAQTSSSSTAGGRENGAQQEQSAGERLIDYPFPLRSGTIALLRLPVRVEKADAERLAAFVRTLVLEPQRELIRGAEVGEADQ
jgi:hypothetical protein